jgi:hypothetical protein
MRTFERSTAILYIAASRQKTKKLYTPRKGAPNSDTPLGAHE